MNSRVPPPKRYHPPHSAQYIPPSRASPSESTIPQATTAEDVYRRPARWLGRALWRDTRNKSRSLLSCTRRQFWSPDWAHNNAPADELIGKFLPGAEVDATRRAAPKLGTAVPPHCWLREVPLIRPGIYQRLYIRTPAHCDINHCPLCASAGKRHAVSRNKRASLQRRCRSESCSGSQPDGCIYCALHAEIDPLEANGIRFLQEENNLDFDIKIISSCSKRKILCWQIILVRRGFLFRKIKGLVDR